MHPVLFLANIQTSMNSWINPVKMALQCPYWLVLAQCVEGHQILDCPLVSICFVFLLRHKFVFCVFFPKTVLSRLSETHSQTMTHGPIQVVKMVKTNSESLYFSKQAGSGKVEVSLNLICTQKLQQLKTIISPTNNHSAILAWKTAYMCIFS